MNKCIEFIRLDPVVNHSIPDRQWTSILFASQSPTVLTGDDYGIVTVYKISRNGNQDEDVTTMGIMSPFVSINSNDEDAIEWRNAQAQQLANVILAKNSISPVASSIAWE